MPMITELSCKNPGTYGDTRLTLVPNFVLVKLPSFSCPTSSMICVQHSITCNITLRAALHYGQHCITGNIALCATLHYVQHCIMCNITFCATLHCMQLCIACNIALHATLHFMQHYITCSIALRATYGQHCIMWNIALVQL